MRPYTTPKQIAAARAFRATRPKPHKRGRTGNVIKDRWKAARRSYKKAARQAGKAELVQWN